MCLGRVSTEIVNRIVNLNLDFSQIFFFFFLVPLKFYMLVNGEL